jgi:hypothetical protein
MAFRGIVVILYVIDIQLIEIFGELGCRIGNSLKCITFSIRIAADCVALSCQVTQKLKRATTFEITTISAIIFIHCYVQFFHIPFSSKK